MPDGLVVDEHGDGYCNCAWPTDCGGKREVECEGCGDEEEEGACECFCGGKKACPGCTACE